MLVLVAFAPPLLSLYVGAETASNAAILAPAVAYVRIRALSLPAALLSGVLSAALLGAKESLTPLLGSAVEEEEGEDSGAKNRTRSRRCSARRWLLSATSGSTWSGSSSSARACRAPRGPRRSRSARALSRCCSSRARS